MIEISFLRAALPQPDTARRKLFRTELGSGKAGASAGKLFHAGD